MMADPHSLIEGCIITCYAIRANFCAIYVRGEALHPLRRVAQRRARGVREGLPGPRHPRHRVRPRHRRARGRGRLHLRRGDGAARLAGRPPRPAPAQAAVPGHRGPLRVAHRGQQRRDDRRRARSSCRAAATGSARWAARRAPARRSTRCPGTSSGPASIEAPMGTTLRELLELAGGMKDGIPLKFWTPGGSSTPLFTAEHLDVPLDFEGAAAAGLDAGHHRRAGVQRDRVRAVGGHEVDRVLQARVLRQVHPVPRGHVLAAADPRADAAPRGHRRRTSRRCSTSATTSSAASFCALGDGATSPITSGIQYFRQEFLDLCAEQPRSRIPTSCAELTGASA